MPRTTRRTLLHAAIYAAIVTLSSSIGAAVAAPQTRDAGTPVVEAWSGVVSGVVLTDTAAPQPVRRATVRLSSDGSLRSHAVDTNDEGRFVFDRLPAGGFTLSATKTGFVQSFYGSTRPGRGPGVPVSVAQGQRVEIAIKLLPAAVISGRITDARGTPVAGMQVLAVDTRAAPRTRPARVETDDRGMYRLVDLAPGEYLVSALPQIEPPLGGHGFRPPGPPVFYPGTTDGVAAVTIRAASGEERAGIDMSYHVGPLSRLGGIVVDGSGRMVRGFVTLMPKRSDQPSPVGAFIASTTVGLPYPLPRSIVSPSNFAFSGVARGQYTLVARTGYGERGAEVGPIHWSVLDVIVDGADRTDLVLRLLPGLEVTGRYFFERGTTAPADPSMVNLSFVATNPMRGAAPTFRAVLNADGTFQVPSLPPGTYVVRADSATGATAPWMLKSAIANGRDLADRPLLAIPGGELSSLVVTLTDRPAEIAGRLIDTARRPVARHVIVVFTPDRSLWRPGARRIRMAQPATDGSFSVSSLPPGEYAIAAVEETRSGDPADPVFLSQLLASSVRVTLADGERKRQDVRTGR